VLADNSHENMTNWRYWLHDRGIKARFPAGLGDFFLLQNVQTEPGVYQAFILGLVSIKPPFVGHWRGGFSLPGGKAARSWR